MDRETMKNMIRERLRESKSSPLYHGTGYKQAYMILKSNNMKVNQSNETETIGISFTRNKNEYYNDVYIKVDQEKLSYNYKISPVYRDGISGRDLAEERVTKDIKDIRKYILEIGIEPSRKIELNRVRNKLVKNFGNHDLVLKNDDKYPDSPLHYSASPYYAHQLILACHEYNIPMNNLLQELEKYINMFLNDEHDEEYEKKIADRKFKKGK